MTSTRELGSYLNDHLAGSVGARQLIRTAMSANAGTPCGTFLQGLLREVEDEVALLEDVMRRMGVRRQTPRLAAGWIAEKVTRLRFDERVTRSANLSRLLELEALVLGVTGKTGLWRSLEAISGQDTRLQVADIDGLIERSERQLAGLQLHRLEASRAAFRR